MRSHCESNKKKISQCIFILNRIDILNILFDYYFKNQSSASTDCVKAEEIIPVGTATIPKPINRIKNVNILPPMVIGYTSP